MYQTPYEALLFLRMYTGQDVQEIQHVFKSHPHWDKLNLVNLRITLNLLKNFSKLQIFNGIHLVLYPPDLVATELKKLPDQVDLQPFGAFQHSPFLLSLLLYYIEKQYNFTGCGVFDCPSSKLKLA